MMIEVFLFQLLREAGPHGVKFWITAAGYTILLAASLTGKWHLFRKNGKTPWHSLVPVLSAYELYDLAWDRRAGIGGWYMPFRNEAQCSYTVIELKPE